MLGLKLPTDPRWVNIAEKKLADIFTDHAYCEQKAASTCISLIQQFPDKTELVEKLAPIVTEEWGHFRQVLAEMKKRGIVLRRQRPDEYVNKIMNCLKKGGSREEQLCERLLLAALIEARSCERFRLLSLHLEEEELRNFYLQFMIAEAAHYRLFIDLAKTYDDPERIKQRWEEFLNYEALIMNSLKVRGDRVH